MFGCSLLFVMFIFLFCLSYNVIVFNIGFDVLVHEVHVVIINE